MSSVERNLYLLLNGGNYIISSPFTEQNTKIDLSHQDFTGFQTVQWKYLSMDEKWTRLIEFPNKSPDIKLQHSNWAGACSTLTPFTFNGLQNDTPYMNDAFMRCKSFGKDLTILSRYKCSRFHLPLFAFNIIRPLLDSVADRSFWDADSIFTREEKSPSKCPRKF